MTVLDIKWQLHQLPGSSSSFTIMEPVNDTPRDRPSSSSPVELDILETHQGIGPVHAYPRPDHGREAWLFLWVGCFLMIALTWGE